MSNYKEFSKPQANATVETIHLYNDLDGKFLYQKIRYIPKAFLFQHLENDVLVWGRGNGPVVPYRLDAWKNSSTVLICEGERDSDRIAELGFATTTSPYGTNKNSKHKKDKSAWDPQLNPYFKNKICYLCYHVGNDNFAREVARNLAGIASEIKICNFEPHRPYEFDLTNLIETVPSDGDPKPARIKLIQEYLASAKDYDGLPEELILIAKKAIDVPTEKIIWIWRNVIPVGMVTILIGDPGVGKTHFVSDIASRISTGRSFPIYGLPGEPVKGNVIIITSEGVIEQILKPRLVAAGADLNCIEILEGFYNKQGEFVILDLSRHLPYIYRKYRNNSDLKLLAVDPFAAHLDTKININDALQMRAALDCASRFAREFPVGTLIAAHLNKDDKKAAIYRAAGSIQLIAATPSTWAITKDREDENERRRHFSPVKSNIAQVSKSLSFTIEDVTIPTSDGDTTNTAKILWAAEPEFYDIEKALSPGRFQGISKTNEAEVFILKELATGPVEFNELVSRAEKVGLSKNDLYNAKKRKLPNVDSYHEAGWQGKWYWMLIT